MQSKLYTMCSICTTTATTTTKPQRKFYWANSKTAETKVKLALQSLCSASFAQHRSLSLSLTLLHLSFSLWPCLWFNSCLSVFWLQFICLFITHTPLLPPSRFLGQLFARSARRIRLELMRFIPTRQIVLCNLLVCQATRICQMSNVKCFADLLLLFFCFFFPPSPSHLQRLRQQAAGSRRTSCQQ